jgi:DNA repair ATPase RecN
MEDITLKRVWTIEGHKFEITSYLKKYGLTITHIIKYEEKSGYASGFQMNHHYINLENLSENYDQIFEKCEAIAERLSGWKNVIDKLSEDGFEIIENI